MHTTNLPHKVREEITEILINLDIDSIREGFHSRIEDTKFLHSVLSGSGWVPYNQLTDRQLLEEFLDREFDDDYTKLQQKYRDRYMRLI